MPYVPLYSPSAHAYHGGALPTELRGQARDRVTANVLRSPAVEGFLERPIGRTWYRVSGKPGRTPLVALHGGPGSTHNYFAPLERLAGERPVVLYDQLGCGRSVRTQPG